MQRIDHLSSSRPAVLLQHVLSGRKCQVGIQHTRHTAVASICALVGLVEMLLVAHLSLLLAHQLLDELCTSVADVRLLLCWPVACSPRKGATELQVASAAPQQLP